MLRKVLGYLIYLPNVTPLRVLFSSEIFPWAFLYALRKDLRLTLPYAIFLAYLVISVSVNLGNFSDIFVPARAFFALVNASMIFFLLIHLKHKEFKFLSRAFEWVFLANVVISFIQYVGMFPDFLEPLMRFFIDRFTTEIYGGGRGVGGLFAEPSYFSLSLHYYFAYFMLNRKIEPRSTLGFVAISAMIAFDIMIVRSVTGLVMIAIYLASLQKFTNLLKIGAVLTVVFYVSLVYLSKQEDVPRSVDVAVSFFKEKDYQDPLPWLLEQSGFRFVSVWAAYEYGFTHPFGSGIGGWGNASIEAMDAIGVPASAMSFFASAMGSEYQGVRPTSYAAGLMLETGIVGLLLFLVAFFPYISRKELYLHPNSRSLAVFFLFNIFALGSIGDPIPFIFLALAYRTIIVPADAEDETDAVDLPESLEITSNKTSKYLT
ncbi:MAG: hypothetical protein PHG67_10325 [Bacteroidales bacterium]|nr:hypothetical protein [Bacteroidales bacterium]HOI31850.1 hypothetical protein [Bacteroidales bacterium]